MRYLLECRPRPFCGGFASCRETGPAWLDWVPCALVPATWCRQGAWRRVVQLAVGAGIGVPGMTSSLSYFDTYRRGRLPANLVQVPQPPALSARPCCGEPWKVFVPQPSTCSLPSCHQCHGKPLPHLHRESTLVCAPALRTAPQAQRDFFGSHTYERTDGKEGWFHTGKGLPWPAKGPRGEGAPLFVGSPLGSSSQPWPGRIRPGPPAVVLISVVTLLRVASSARAVWDPTFGSLDSITTSERPALPAVHGLGSPSAAGEWLLPVLALRSQAGRAQRRGVGLLACRTASLEPFAPCPSRSWLQFLNATQMTGATYKPWDAKPACQTARANQPTPRPPHRRMQRQCAHDCWLAAPPKRNECTRLCLPSPQ